jgi:hypothetical protein
MKHLRCHYDSETMIVMSSMNAVDAVLKRPPHKAVQTLLLR